ncbi:hypothetical protein C0993_011028 [Termitomyces sp. T159_Od127]|nr:hypothetical protein C0993_011028 [Termitomyces sp. T159_Od127]
MSTDPGPISQSQSLLLLSSTPTNPCGASSTSDNTQTYSLSTTVTPHSPNTRATESKDSTITEEEQGTALETADAEGGSSQVGEGVKGPEQAAEHQHDLELIKEGEGSVVPMNEQMELLEHIPDSVADEGQEWAPEGDHERKRVKVYELIGARWVDQGTAFCFGQFSEDTSEALLIARSEKRHEDIILSTVIRSNDVYQRQQDTLIVWTEPNGVDYALSFQDPEGCTEVWNFICEVQRHMHTSDNLSSLSSSPHIGPDPPSVTTAGIIRSRHLPRPELGIIGEIERAVKTLARTQNFKEQICEYIQQAEYIKSLIEVFNTAEDLESLENLHALCSMMQTILMLNDHTMYEHILEDDLFFGVVGMLEYDPDFPNHKANYREFLHQTTHFHQPIQIRDPSIQRKVHHTYRLQFLKDVVLARALDDSTFNVLNSCIIFNQIDIIMHVQNDQGFLREIVKLFVDECMLSAGAPPAAPPTMTNGRKPMSVAGLNVDTDGNFLPGYKNDEPDAMEVDQNQAPSNAKANGDVGPHPNGRGTLATVLAPSSSPPKRPDHYAFAPPDDLADEEIELRREVIILVQQLCVMGKNVQLATRLALFRALVDRGVLFGVQWAIGLPEREEVNKPMISAAGEILVALLDHDLNGVRSHVLKQVVAIEKERAGERKGADKAETILEMACRIMAQSKDLAVQSQVGEALKVWMDVPLGEAAATALVAAGTEAGQVKVILGDLPIIIDLFVIKALGAHKQPPRKDDPGTERYMDYFYKDCLGILFKPFFDLPEWRNVQETVLPLAREETNRYVYLSDLMYNFVAQHHFRIHFYIISSNILVRLASLLKARDKHLRHASFRIFRLLLRQNNPNIHIQIMKHDVVKPLLDLTLQESRRDNLLSCSCQEYFDFMRKEKIKELGKFCWTKHEEELRKLAQSPLGGQRFEQFNAWIQFEMLQQNKEPLPADIRVDKMMDSRSWQSSGRALDAEEENYFNTDDDDDLIPVVSSTRPRVAPLGTPAQSALLKRKRRSSIGGATKGYRPPLRNPIMGSLVSAEYGDEDEDDGRKQSPEGNSQRVDPSSSRSPSPEIPASPKMAHRQVTMPASGPPPKRLSREDDDDDILETIARSRFRPQSPAPGMMASLDSLRPSEKRRRGNDDDDDDVITERLSKAKKLDLGTLKEKFSFGAIGRTKNGDDSSKKIKVKLGVTSLNAVVTPSTPAPSETGAKDGDTG